LDLNRSGGILNPVDFKRFGDIEFRCEYTGASLYFQFEAVAGGGIGVDAFEGEVSILVGLVRGYGAEHVPDTDMLKVLMKHDLTINEGRTVLVKQGAGEADPFREFQFEIEQGIIRSQNLIGDQVSGALVDPELNRLFEGYGCDKNVFVVIAQAKRIIEGTRFFKTPSNFSNARSDIFGRNFDAGIGGVVR
jgi:hypothetical protein